MFVHMTWAWTELHLCQGKIGDLYCRDGTGRWHSHAPLAGAAIGTTCLAGNQAKQIKSRHPV